MMSISLRNSAPPHLEHFVPGGRMSANDWRYHASAPSRAKRATTFLFTSFERSSVLHDSLAQKNTAMGTPQMRCRLMHQSGRVAIMLEMRSSPHDGSQWTFLISSSARCRKVLPSTLPPMLMNHCSVARKMTGLWHRQQCG